MGDPATEPHGHFHGKLVRVHPERVDVAEYRATTEHYTGRPCTMTDDEIRASVLAHARERNYEPGDVAKVVMVSRFGDCGVTKLLDAQHGYNLRLYPECLEKVPDDEAHRILSVYRR